MVLYDKDYKALNVPAGIGNPSGNEVVSGVTPEEVEQMIDEALVDYPTTAVTNDLQQQIDAISGQTGTEVVWDQRVSAGTKIAEITIDGTMTEVYAPTSGGGGVTPEDVQDAIDSALTPYSTTQQVQNMISGFTTEADAEQIASQAVNNFSQNEFQPFAEQVGEDLEGKQDTLTPGTNIQISGNTINCTITDYAKDYYVNWAELRAMTQQDRIDYFGTLTQKVQDGYTVYAVGKTNADSYDIKIPLVEFRAEETGIAGWARFAGISTKNITGVTEGYNIIYASYNSNGFTYPDNAYLDRTLEFYELPVADATTLGGVKVGSGLTIDANGVLSATGGGGGGDYIVTEALSAVTNPTEGQMATVEGYNETIITSVASFTDYSNYDGSAFVTLYRSSDDGWMKDIRFEDGEFRDDINNDGLWHTYIWEGQEVTMRAVRDTSNPENSTLEIYAGVGAYMVAGSYSEVNSSSITVFHPAKTYVRTGSNWYQYGKVYKWSEIKDNTVAQAQALVAEVRMLAKTGVPIWFDFESKDGIESVIPYINDSGTWLNFVGAGFQYGSGRYVHLYLSDTIFDDNGFDSHGIRIDNNDIVNLPGTQCIYVGPNGDIWSHRSPGNAFEEQNQPYMAVKGCLEDFSEEYGFGSILYTMKNYDSGQDQWTYTICMLVPTPNGVMKGVWASHDMYDVSQYTRTSWTAY